jgi:hypothetical protein
MPIRIIFLAFLTLVVVVEHLALTDVGALPQKSSASKQSERWRKQAPKADTPRSFALPAMRETRFENGLTVLFIEDHRSPIVTILVGIPLAIDPSEDTVKMTAQMALAEATAELITEGAGSRTSEQVAREVETLGGRLSSSANDDYAEVAVSVVAENAERMMDLLGDVLLRPAFPESEVRYTNAIEFRLSSSSDKTRRSWPVNSLIESSLVHIHTRSPLRRLRRSRRWIAKSSISFIGRTFDRAVRLRSSLAISMQAGWK